MKWFGYTGKYRINEKMGSYWSEVEYLFFGFKRWERNSQFNRTQRKTVEDGVIHFLQSEFIKSKVIDHGEI